MGFFSDINVIVFFIGSVIIQILGYRVFKKALNHLTEEGKIIYSEPSDWFDYELPRRSYFTDEGWHIVLGSRIISIGGGLIMMGLLWKIASQ